MGVRAEQRERIVAEVMRLGREQLAEVGAPGLSLRAIARELGMVSSAVYRYFPSRDTLLTALIIETYTEMGDAAEAAERRVARADLHGRVLATARAMRAWALANSHEYALVYGSPVPGYVAPQDTIEPAARIPMLLLGVLRDLPEPPPGAAFPKPALAALHPLRGSLAPDVDPRVLALGYSLWEFLIGAITVEAFGHQVNVIDSGARAREALFAAQVGAVASLVLGPRA